MIHRKDAKSAEDKFFALRLAALNSGRMENITAERAQNKKTQPSSQ